jgi:hypothetical protein
MRTDPLVDALTGHLLGNQGRYALENGFHVVVEGAVLARADPRARSGLQPGEWRGGQAGTPGAEGRAARTGGPRWSAGDHRDSATAPMPPIRQVSRTTDRVGLAHRARDDGDGMTEHEVRSSHGEAGSPTP